MARGSLRAGNFRTATTFAETATPAPNSAGSVKPKQVVGKRVLIGAYIASALKRRIRDVAEGKNKSSSKARSLPLQNGIRSNKRKKDQILLPLDISVSNGTDTIYCSLLLDTPEQLAKIVGEFEKAKGKETTCSYRAWQN